MKYTIVEFIQDYLKGWINTGDLCIDGTAGNGNDTRFLCKNVGKSGRVIALDIQKLAVDNTQKLLYKEGYDDVATVALDSHENINLYAEENTVSVIMFNLGYLPGGDHSIATKPESTINAVDKALKLIKSGGIISICIYSGGDSGFEERDRILNYLRKIDCNKYNVIKSEFINKPNNPPIPIFIIKK